MSFPLTTPRPPTPPVPCPAPADHVYVEIKRQAKDAMLKLVEAEREGEQIDKSLLKNVLRLLPTDVPCG